ncbi:MAG: hypothetical protein KDE51_11210 [Anaerolineales bacterium]|nr:hypothetical protein [Anaerolineales bacterium]
MIATLRGRWQTRLYLLLIIGGLVTIPFGLWNTVVARSIAGYIVPYVVLVLVLLLGFVWDVLYNFLQKMTWDHDWPPILQILTGLAEANVVWLLIQQWNQVAPPNLRLGLSLGAFALHYTTVWLVTFLFAQGAMRILFPRWRFYGGEIWR